MIMTVAAPAPEYRLETGERRLAIGAVLIVLLLSALDQTIVSTAMPRIIAELHGLERIAWVGTSYLLASTVVVPIYGKLGDLYGRRPILVFGVVVFLIGSMLCGLAGEFGSVPIVGDGMNQLIVCRALQGIGAGALTTGAFATIADIVPPAERGKYTGLFGAMFGFASVAGPVIGGALTEHATTVLFGHVISGWRFVFYVNLPLGAVALWILLNRLPNTGGQVGGERRVDWIGSALILMTFVPLLLALTWGGHAYAWGSPVIVAMLGGAVAGLAVLLLYSRNKDHAVVPLGLFANPVFARGNLALFIINVAFMGIVMFLPLYLQVARGVTATASGFALLPLMGGVLVGSVVSGRTASKTKQYKPVLVVGGLLSLLGVGLMLQVGPETSRNALMLRLAVLGLGLGPAMGMFTLAIQSAVEPRRVGVATASAQFFRQIGSTIGVALFGAILTNTLTAELPRRAPDLVRAGSVDMSHAQALAMDPAALKTTLAANGVTDPDRVARTGDGIRASFSAAILGLFPISAILFLGAFIVTLAVPGRRLRGREEAGEMVAIEAGAPAE
ncbi:MFS transporter [Polymorphobacter sp. PAMC 29334]|uniref:MDR family MFS transporter n=1 Tax=Polymorphobacter sp. PAMC 29334 TaxID=2862331 RepID=UPI001C66D878|nr:MDR family MFS transporter [Polymorphobacter sp. PAMC 29334]QYE35498.1 MFS transporter [Polymorphobacter sp. PAMC 29334]